MSHNQALAAWEMNEMVGYSTRLLVCGGVPFVIGLDGVTLAERTPVRQSLSREDGEVEYSAADDPTRANWPTRGRACWPMPCGGGGPAGSPHRGERIILSRIA